MLRVIQIRHLFGNWFLKRDDKGCELYRLFGKKHKTIIRLPFWSMEQ